MNHNTKETIEKMITENPIMLFMKGNKKFPMCGFSSVAVQILNQLGVTYETFNILEDEEIRAGIKEYSDWPTIPQLYIEKEFIGGCDIMKEMFEDGELASLLSGKGYIKAS